MRHFPPVGPVAALTLGMLELTSPGSLITPPGGTYRLSSGRLGTGCTAVNIASVATTADHHLTMTSGAVEYACGRLHRLLLPMRTGLIDPRERYCVSDRASHGLEVWQRDGLAGQARCRTCLNGPDGLTDYCAFVIFYSWARLLLPCNNPSETQVFTTLVG